MCGRSKVCVWVSVCVGWGREAGQINSKVEQRHINLKSQETFSLVTATTPVPIFAGIWNRIYISYYMGGIIQLIYVQCPIWALHAPSKIRCQLRCDARRLVYFQSQLKYLSTWSASVAVVVSIRSIFSICLFLFFWSLLFAPSTGYIIRHTSALRSLKLFN